MNKRNKILVGCLALLLVLSVGYALFGETITINGTATAKGNFAITTTCDLGYDDDLVALGMPSADYNQVGFENSECDVTDNAVTMTTDLLYPTAGRIFTVKMTNSGSMPAVMWGVTDSERLESFDVMQGASWKLKSKETDDIIKSGVGEQTIHSYIRYVLFFAISKDGDVNADQNAIYNKQEDYAGIKLNPGDSLLFTVRFWYPDGSEKLFSDNGKSEYFEFILNHEFKWEQYVDSSDYEPTTFGDWGFNAG